MKQLAELVPILLFFLVYKMDGYQLQLGPIDYQFDGIYSATAVLMLATIAQVVFARLSTGKLEKRQLWLLVAVLVFLGSQFIGKRNLIARTLGSQLEVPYPVWTRLNYMWSAYFFVVGALNIYVAYRYSQDFWVSYKLYSSIGFTVALSILTVALLAPHIQEQESDQG